jgi:hypothetical protein
VTKRDFAGALAMVVMAVSLLDKGGWLAPAEAAVRATNACSPTGADHALTLTQPS